MARGLRLPLTYIPDLGGRWTMPSQTYVQVFDKEHRNSGRQFDFVAHLQGDTKTQTAHFASEAEFQKSHELPQYDWLVPAAIERLKKQAAERTTLAEPWVASKSA